MAIEISFTLRKMNISGTNIKYFIHKWRQFNLKTEQMHL